MDLIYNYLTKFPEKFSKCILIIVFLLSFQIYNPSETYSNAKIYSLPQLRFNFIYS